MNTAGETQSVLFIVKTLVCAFVGISLTVNSFLGMALFCGSLWVHHSCKLSMCVSIYRIKS